MRDIERRFIIYNVKYIFTPVLYGRAQPWYEDVILFLTKKERYNFIKLNIFDLCFECSRHKELLLLFNEKEMYFKSIENCKKEIDFESSEYWRFCKKEIDFSVTEYWIFCKKNKLEDSVILKKIKKFKKLYYSIKKRIKNGRQFEFINSKKSSIIITEDGYVVDGGHRLSILKYLNVTEAYINVIKYKMLFSKKKITKIKKRNKEHRKKLEQNKIIKKRKKIKILYNKKYEF